MNPTEEQRKVAEKIVGDWEYFIFPPYTGRAISDDSSFSYDGKWVNKDLELNISQALAQAKEEGRREGAERVMKAIEIFCEKRVDLDQDKWKVVEIAQKATLGEWKPNFTTTPTENDTPMGVSAWKEHGKKYGYWDYFKKEAANNNDQN